MSHYLRLISVLFASTLLSALPLASQSLGMAERIVTGSEPEGGAFPLASADRLAPLHYDAGDWPGVIRAIGDLGEDIFRVTGRRPESFASQPTDTLPVIVGTLGKSALIDALAASGKLDVSDLDGKWESFVITTVREPFAGVQEALVIAGSDKRGTIYGIYELSEQLGVSPWYWWADVPPKHRDEAYVLPGRFASGEPVVRYRGIFLNDERPCLTEWTREKFGGLNHEFYTKVFELLLRMRANYLWPAMWDNAFNTDDPENPRLADEYGIVMGTSHHEPMMRAHKEWVRSASQYGNGQWNYATNSEALRRFFREGIVNNAGRECLVTIGMRGDGDEAMSSTGSIESDIAQLVKIMDDQRQIIGDVMQTDPAKVPQLWALFTEVQSFYEHGLRPPDDVTLLWTDDNVGNMRRLPTAEERQRSGGAGIYYHIDMHGGPFAFQWINTNPLPKIAEQFNLAWQYDATRIWIVNVGDLKPLEIPIEFILRMAWNPAAMTKDDVAAYTRNWAEREFGPEHADAIADIVARYGKYNGWRKPELVTPDTFSQLNFMEADRVEEAWTELVAEAEAIYDVLAPECRDAYYQLVLHPAKASAVVNLMNIAAGRNKLYAMQGRVSTNAQADLVRELFREDRALSDYYNNELAGGKWSHLMDQTHLGQYTWQPPNANMMPAVSEVIPLSDDFYGVAIEGDVSAWPDHWGAAVLPRFDSFNTRRSWVDVYAMGVLPIEGTYSVSADSPWIRLATEAMGTDRRYWVDIDWSLAPEGDSTGRITIKCAHRTPFGDTIVVQVPIRKAGAAQLAEAKGRFASLNGTISIDPVMTSARTEVGGAQWEEVPDYGRVDAAMAVYPVTTASILPPEPSPSLEYPIWLARDGKYEVTLILGPVMDFVPDRGMRIALGFDVDTPCVLDIFENRADESFLGRNWWAGYTRDNARVLHATFDLAAGIHTLRVSMVDPGIVLQKIVISEIRSSGRGPTTGGPIQGSYFGPPEMMPVR